MGGLVRAGQRRRRHELAGKRAHRTAPQILAVACTPLGRRPASRRLLRRVVVDPARDRDDGARLEFSGRTIPVLRPRAGPTNRRAALHRAQRRAADHRVRAPYDCRIRPLDPVSANRAGVAARRRASIRLESTRAAAVHSGVFGLPMTAGGRFGAELQESGVIFRLWAPAAKRVEVMLDRVYPMQAGPDGWYEVMIPQAGAGTLYKYRIDGDLEIPDPASHFQPQDLFGPSEVVDHDRFEWRATGRGGPPREEEAGLGSHIAPFSPPGGVSAGA